MYFDENVNEICSPGPNQHYSSICSDNGLAPVMAYFNNAYMRHSASIIMAILEGVYTHDINITRVIAIYKNVINMT